MESKEAKKLKELGFDVTETNKAVSFKYKGNLIKFSKLKQWAWGKGIKDCRGFDSLIKQINPKNKDEKFVDFYTNNPESYNHLIGIFQKHTKYKLSEQQKISIKENMKRRFKIMLNH